MRLAAVLFAALILLGLVAALLPARARAADVPALLLPPTLGRPDRVWVSGRVLEEKHGDRGPAAYRTARVLAGSNLPGADVEVSFLGQVGRAVSGHDGEFEVELAAPADRPFPVGRHEAQVHASAGRGPRAKAVTESAVVEVVSPDAPFLLVSDFDDTVAVTNVTDKGKLLAATFLQDAETQPAVPGMAALYRCLTAGGAPLAFVSGSPVQLAPRLSRFLEKHGFPPAALYLRNVGPHTLSGYKEPVLARLLARFPELPLLLVGDSGEKDPEIFAALAKDHPGRVLRAYVRKATPEPGPARRFEGLLLFADPAEVEADARGRGIVAGACPAP
jgi:phosphatidate phosphatase APP1